MRKKPTERKKTNEEKEKKNWINWAKLMKKKFNIKKL